MASTKPQQVAESLFPGNLPHHVAHLRDQGWSWRRVAEDVNDQMPGVASISYESLRTWYGEPTQQVPA